MRLRCKWMLPLLCLALSSCAESFPLASARPFRLDEEGAANESSIETEDAENAEQLRISAPRLWEVGDCTLFSYKDHHALIDTGGGKKGSEQIYNLLSDRVTSGKLDYLFVTHSDADHIFGMISKDAGVGKWISEMGHSVGTYVDFDSPLDVTVTDEKIRNALEGEESDDDAEEEEKKESKLTRYRETRDGFRSGIGKKIDRYFTASQLHYASRGIEAKEVLKADNLKGLGEKDLKTEFRLGEGENAPVFTLLYNPFEARSGRDEDEESSTPAQGIINNLSLCLGVEYANKKSLFTGDLMEYLTDKGSRRLYGETELLEHNEAYFDRPFELIKAAHHGSRSSSSPDLLAATRPSHVLIEAVGNGKHNFPSEDAVLSLLDYTDRIAITQVSPKTGGERREGTIEYTLSFDAETKVEEVDEAGERTLIESSYEEGYLADQRKARLGVYNLQTDKLSNGYNTNCAYVKAGGCDVLIGLGSEGKNFSRADGNRLVKKIEYLCNDGVLDYLILPSQSTSSCIALPYLIQSLQNKKISRIGKLIYNGCAKEGNSKDFADKIKQIESFLADEERSSLRVSNGELRFNMLTGEEVGSVSDCRLGLSILKNPKNTDNAPANQDVTAYSLLTRISFAGEASYLNFGTRCDYGDDVLEHYPSLRENVPLLQMAGNGMLENREGKDDSTSVDALAESVSATFTKLTPVKGRGESGTDKYLNLLCQGAYGLLNSFGSGEGCEQMVDTLVNNSSRRFYFSHLKNRKGNSAVVSNPDGTGDLLAYITLYPRLSDTPKDYRIQVRYAKHHDKENKGVLRFNDNKNFRLGSNEDSYLATRLSHQNNG